MNTPQEFYEFFDKLPEDKWLSRSIGAKGEHCALGHLNCVSTFGDRTQDAENLTKILSQSRAIEVKIGSSKETSIVWHINDGYYYSELKSPKERILFALKLAMDSESIADWLDELALSFLDDFDSENGIVKTSIQSISQSEFERLIGDSTPVASEYVPTKIVDDGFLQSLLDGASEEAQQRNERLKG